MAQYFDKELTENRKKLLQKILADTTHGKHVYLLGSAEFGPTNEPINIKSTIGLYNKFGRRGSLINAFHEFAYTVGPNSDITIYCVKTTGEHATALLNVYIPDSDFIDGSFIINAAESNEAYNDIKILVDIESISFIFPEEFGLPVLTYKYSEYPTMDELAEAINEDTRIKKNKLYAFYTCDPSTKTEDAFYVCNPNVITMNGGLCGLHYSKDMLYNCLDKTYDILESSKIDIIVPADAFIDDVHPYDADEFMYRYNMKYYHTDKDYLTCDTLGNQKSYMNQLITFCAKQLNHGIVTHGILGFNSCKNIASNYLYDADDLKDMFVSCMEYNKSLVDYPQYSFMVSAVAGDIRYNKSDIIDNGYLAYAGFCTLVQKNVGTTNIPLSNTISIYHEFDNDVLAELADNGIVAFRHSPLYEKPVVYNGVTVSDDEMLRLYVNARMIQMAISYLDEMLEFYIGLNFKQLMDANIIAEDVNKILNTLNQIGVITNYQYDLEPDYAEGELKLNLSMMTNYMTEAVVVNTTIKAEYKEEGLE